MTKLPSDDRRDLKQQLAYINDRLQGENLSDDEKARLREDAGKLQRQLQNSCQPQNVDTLNELRQVEIGTGDFKYVLVSHEDETGNERYFIRGDPQAAYHVECAVPLLNLLSQKGYSGTVKGGGRIRHTRDPPEIAVYGFSYQYGEADHSKTVEILQKSFDSSYNIYFE